MKEAKIVLEDEGDFASRLNQHLLMGGQEPLGLFGRR